MDAGATRTLALPDTLTLDPSVTLDGTPVGDRAAYRWSQLEGPDAVSFSNVALATPVAIFPRNGSYRLKLEVSHSVQTVGDVLEVTVNTRAAGAVGITVLPDNTVQCVAPANAAIPNAIKLLTVVNQKYLDRHSHKIMDLRISDIAESGLSNDLWLDLQNYGLCSYRFARFRVHTFDLLLSLDLQITSSLTKRQRNILKRP